LRDTSNKNLIPARAAAKVSPKAGRFETHHKSKRWVLLSPDGETYEVKNLELFAREHCAEYGATAKQMGDGIRKIKASMQGKRKNPCYQWHGWTLVDGDEL
jgi:hypothetical protein